MLARWVNELRLQPSRANDHKGKPERRVRMQSLVVSGRKSSGVNGGTNGNYRCFDWVYRSLDGLRSARECCSCLRNRAFHNVDGKASLGRLLVPLRATKQQAEFCGLTKLSVLENLCFALAE